MQKPGIIGILEYSEHFHNCIPTHIQNPVIFTKIGKPCVILEIQNSDTLYNPGNSKPWHTDIPGIFRALKYLKPDTYSGPSHRLKMKCFAKINKSYAVIIFSKALYLRSLPGF